MTPHDHHWMHYALNLAKRGQGAVEPNPMVGAVVVSANGELLSEGWHERYGEAHAEVNALAQCGGQALGSTLYVTLEPCCHFGKTPPCTDLILGSGIQRVVVAMRDPFPKVDGGGIMQLRAHGITVDVGLMADEAQKLNAPYLKLLQRNQPWIIGKWAMSLDGKIATRSGESQWISNATSRARVHELRGQVDAIIVGRGTVEADNPLLTARPAGPRIATRVVVTASGQLPANCQLLETANQVPVLIFTSAQGEQLLQNWAIAGAEIVTVPCHSESNSLDISAILRNLSQCGFTNVLVEGGAGLLGSFFAANAIDEVWAFVAPKVIGGNAAPSPVGGIGTGKLADAWQADESHQEILDGDWFIRSRSYQSITFSSS